MTIFRPSREKIILYLAVLFLIFAVVAIYSNTLNAPFLLDDASSIQNNASIRRLWPLQAADIGGTRGRPVANATFALNYAWGGYQLPGYHLANIGIHAAAAVILFGLVCCTFLLPVWRGKYTSTANLLAGSAALIWAVHPLHTESVTYLSQRTESLMGLFYLATLYSFARGLDSSSRPAAAWHALAVLTCFAGMATKEVMVTAPVIVLLYDRAFVAGSFPAALRMRGKFYLALASSWLVLVFTMTSMGGRGVGFSLGVTPYEYALTESAAILRYMKLAVWPTPLVFDYGDQVVRSFVEVWECVVVVSLLAAAVSILVWLKPRAGFVLAWPFLLLAPTSSVVPVALQPMAEHRMYLPLVAAAVAAALILRRMQTAVAWTAVGCIGAVLSIMTYQRNVTYSSEIALWLDTLAKAPANSRGHANLGTAFLNAGRAADAHIHLSRAVELNPRNAEALANLGFLAAQRGAFPEAVQHFESALQLNPAMAETHYNLGCIFLKMGRFVDAGKSLSHALRINPNHGDAHNNLATLLASGGRFESAEHHFSEALRVNPRDAEVYVNRADARLNLGRKSEAAEDYRAALRLRPDLAAVRDKLQILEHSHSSETNKRL